MSPSSDASADAILHDHICPRRPFLTSLETSRNVSSTSVIFARIPRSIAPFSLAPGRSVCTLPPMPSAFDVPSCPLIARSGGSGRFGALIDSTPSSGSSLHQSLSIFHVAGIGSTAIDLPPYGMCRPSASVLGHPTLIGILVLPRGANSDAFYVPAVATRIY